MSNGRHPHFLSPQLWYDSLPEALAEAQRSGRFVLVQLGRQSCGGCRALVEKTVAKEEIHEYLDQHYVCLAQDLDHLAPDVQALLAPLADLQRTPYCLYLRADGRVVHHSSGGRPPAVFLTELIEGVSRAARLT
jgi:hypothetical protein